MKIRDCISVNFNYWSTSLTSFNDQPRVVFCAIAGHQLNVGWSPEMPS